MNRDERATEKFLSGYNCAQSVLWAFSEELGLPSDTALKLATGLGAGMARRQEVCGAITGGILVLSLRYGRSDGQDRTATEETYAKTRELMSRFEAEYGTCNCRELLGGCDIATEEGRKIFIDSDLLNTTCTRCVQSVIHVLENMVQDDAQQAAAAGQPAAAADRLGR
jgi:C_GCAxxG_C_C family probable redox protein